MEHHLIPCENNDLFWQRVFHWWVNSFDAWFQVDTYEIIVGILKQDNNTLVNQLNYIILLGQYYIYTK
jgi:hypothetical protein